MLENEAELVRANRVLKAAERKAELDQLAAALARFESIFSPKRHQALREAGEWRLSWQALQAALFINLYRHEPVLQMPYRLLNAAHGPGRAARHLALPPCADGPAHDRPQGRHRRLLGP